VLHEPCELQNRHFGKGRQGSGGSTQGLLTFPPTIFLGGLCQSSKIGRSRFGSRRAQQRNGSQSPGCIHGQSGMTTISTTTIATISIPPVGRRRGIGCGLGGLWSEISIHSDLSISLTEIQAHRFGLGQADFGLPGLILGSICRRCRGGKGGGGIPTDSLLMKCIQFQAIPVLQTMKE